MSAHSIALKGNTKDDTVPQVRVDEDRKLKLIRNTVQKLLWLHYRLQLASLYLTPQQKRRKRVHAIEIDSSMPSGPAD
jgi:hypothetical protein